MDLTYMPGELDVKNAKKGNGSDLKREHDSVDDFEHLDPDLSPGDAHAKDKFDMKGDIKDYNVNADLIEKSHGDEFGLPSKSVDLLSGKLSPDSNLLSEFGLESKQIKTEVDLHFGNEGKSSLLDFETNNDNFVSEIGGGISDDLNKSFISAEISDNRAKTENELPILDIKFDDSDKEITESHTTDIQGTAGKEIDLSLTGFSDDLKSMKEADALPQYDIKLERRESPEKEECTTGIEKELDDNEPEFQDEQDEDFLPPIVEKSVTPEPKTVSHEDISDLKQSANLIGSPVDLKETPRVEEPQKPEIFTKPISPVSKEDTKPVVKKMSMSDLDDIIGPEDVFKRIGLVEALVYWRDPKKSGVVFGGGMVILLSLCFMSLISVIAYTSLFALTGAICFRIYKNILQAVQKTSEGHPFKEFLDLELSLPQDKVREVVDTAVVHLNAAVVELRRLFLVEDLIDSIKFGVCLWCLTYVGAIFNGMTLVILAFVALFTVPKIYENNKASIDQYIDMGRSKVAEITSKVKAAVPIGKKEPEKDKEQ